MRLIDAEYVLWKVQSAAFPQSVDFGQGRESVLEEIRKAPTVDAEPVVRCKDCKNCEMGAITAQCSDGSVKVENLCHRNKWSVRGTDYCNYAEPKE